MRRILVENAQHKKRRRHGGGWQRVDFAGRPPSCADPLRGRIS
jgi:hypothetical protein